MKRYLLTALALFTLIQLSSAQLLINPKVGLTTSNLKTDPDSIISSNRIGWEAGVDLYFGQTIYFNTGVHFRNIRFDFETSRGDENNLEVEDDIHWTELRIPAHVGLYVINSETLKVHAGVGVSAMVHLNTRDNDFEIRREHYQPIVLGGDAVVGVSVWRFTLDATYQVGLSRVFEGVDDSNNNVVTLSLGFLLGDIG